MRTELIWINNIDVLKINRWLYIANYTRKQKIKLMDFLNNENAIIELELSDKKSLYNFRDDILNFWAKISELSLIEFFSLFIKETKILEYIEKNWNFDDIQDIFTLFNKIKEWNNKNKNINITVLIEKIELYNTYNYPIPRQILIENKLWVNILTAHWSKWLEFNTVFIPGLYTWNWDTKKTRDLIKLPIWIIWEWLQNSNFDQIEEDRRLLFVAITRTEENLFLSYPAWIWVKPLIESIFIDEINWEYDEIIYSNWNNTIIEIIKNNLENNLIKYNQLEFDYIKNFLETYKLSPSDLNSFIENPILFLERTIYKYPFEENKYTIFGKVYHRTLELYYLKYKKEWILPEKSYLTSTFKLLLEKEILIPEEYEKLLENWISGLEWYYDLYSKNITIPLELEYSFRRKNILFEWIPITWIIDKIEKSSSQTTNFLTWNENQWLWQMAFFKEKVDLIDYKTWNIKSLWQVKWTDRYWNKKIEEWKYFRQLMFYKLLCEIDKEFNSKYEVWNIVIDFVEWKDSKYKYLEVEYTQEDYEEFKNELKNAWSKINDINFWKELLKK
jgi:DNA helicase-2/ATP-dependent DNA helicase PcrA